MGCGCSLAGACPCLALAWRLPGVRHSLLVQRLDGVLALVVEHEILVAFGIQPSEGLFDGSHVGLGQHIQCAVVAANVMSIFFIGFL